MAVFAVTSKLKLALKKRYIRIITGYILIAEIKDLNSFIIWVKNKSGRPKHPPGGTAFINFTIHQLILLIKSTDFNFLSYFSEARRVLRSDLSNVMT